MQINLKRLTPVTIVLLLSLFVIGCSGGQEAMIGDEEHGHEAEEPVEMLSLPELATVDSDRPGDERLKVVATTSIISDVVAQVGGEAIELTALMPPGQDPHSYKPAARDLAAAAEADVIFVNGWDLEERLVGDLENIAGEAPIVPISASITPLAFGEEGHDHGADPHVWFSVPNVVQWVDNTEQVLSKLDPDNAEVYANNAVAYLAELDELQAYAESTLGEIPEDRRYLVTNHDSLGYFAQEYGYEVLGTVIPAASTLAEPSASDLAALTETMAAHGICTIFTETGARETLAQTVAGELAECDEVKVVQLYTGATGPAGSGADSYIGMFRANVDAIVEGLK